MDLRSNEIVSSLGHDWVNIVNIRLWLSLIDSICTMTQLWPINFFQCRIHFLWWCGRQSHPLGDLHSFLYPQEWNWTVSVTIRTFWKLNCFPGQVSTSIVHLGLFNKTPLGHMVPKSLKSGFRPTFQHSLAKMNGPQGARIWTLLTFLCGQFWRVRFAELLMIRWIIWSWSCNENCLDPSRSSACLLWSFPG